MADTATIEPPAAVEGSDTLPVEDASSFAPTQNDQNENNDQDTTMGGQEDDASKSTKTGDATPLPATTPQAPVVTSTTTTATNGASPSAANTPARTSTPTSRIKDEQPATTSASRAPSAVPTDRIAMPAEAAENGAPTRVYLNSKVTQHVLDGMKVLAKEKPADPLRVLGEFLLKRSAEYEAAVGSEDKDMNGAEQ